MKKSDEGSFGLVTVGERTLVDSVFDKLRRERPKKTLLV